MQTARQLQQIHDDLLRDLSELSNLRGETDLDANTKKRDKLNCLLKSLAQYLKLLRD